MESQQFLINITDKQSVTAVRTKSNVKGDKKTFIYAPGAGSNISDPFGLYLDKYIPRLGYDILRFQFPYMESGKKRPDNPSILKETWKLVIGQAGDLKKVIIGGRSMGGRIASEVASEGLSISGLVLFAYPLIPRRGSGKPRDDHFPDVQVPTLFCSGTRDSFCTPEQLKLSAAKIGNSQVMLLDGADHGFAVLKSTGRDRADVWSDIGSDLRTWLNFL